MTDKTATAEAEKADTPDLVELTSEIAAAYIAHSHVPAADVSALLQAQHGAANEITCTHSTTMNAPFGAWLGVNRLSSGGTTMGKWNSAERVSSHPLCSRKYPRGGELG